MRRLAGAGRDLRHHVEELGVDGQDLVPPPVPEHVVECRERQAVIALVPAEDDVEHFFGVQVPQDQSIAQGCRLKRGRSGGAEGGTRASEEPAPRRDGSRFG
jgi:hypothetical protein